MKRLLILALLSGCAQTTLMHPTKPRDEWQADLHACQVEAEQRSANWNAQGNVFLIRDYVFECMRVRGYQEVPR